MGNRQFEIPLPFGVDGSSGKVLPGISDDALAWLQDRIETESAIRGGTIESLKRRADMVGLTKGTTRLRFRIPTFFITDSELPLTRR